MVVPCTSPVPVGARLIDSSVDRCLREAAGKSIIDTAGLCGSM